MHVPDASGWCWAIPLHGGTLSVGIVMRQDMFFDTKKNLDSPSPSQLYKECLKLAPQITNLLKTATVTADIKTASDWSYSASAYAGPHFRIVGDAGCFIDPFFSSGVHLALASSLSAAITVQAARRGDCDEFAAAKWHSNTVAEGYTRFLLVVLTALRQIRMRTEPVLSDFDEEGFDNAFAFFRPRNADSESTNKFTQSDVSSTIDFCLNAFNPLEAEKHKSVLEKAKLAEQSQTNGGQLQTERIEKLTPDELAILNTIRARQMLRTEDTLNIQNFSKNVVQGLRPRLERGQLGLVKAEKEEGEEEGDGREAQEGVNRKDMFGVTGPGDGPNPRVEVSVET
ncbi:MAG: hypothetical protein Q9160_002430 [Pyrenula sp. 1 TL-2023]